MIRSRAAVSARLTAAALASVACALCAQGVSEKPAFEPAAKPVIALVLPGQGTVYAQAAEAVRQGFFAAHRAAGAVPAIQVLEIDDEATQLAAALAGAKERGVTVAVGPLTRSAVNAVVDAGRVPLPLVTLNYPEQDGGAPATLLAFGLSAEAEAQ